MLLFFTTIGVCFASGFIPIINAELYLIGIGLSGADHRWILYGLAAAIGQSAAKTCIYLLAKYSDRFLLSKKYQQNLQKVQAFQEKWKNAGVSVIFCSATTGFPPLFLTSIYSGLTQFNLIKFMIATFFGRWIRFSVILLFPNILVQISHFLRGLF